MKIRCECGREFATPNHDDVVDFAAEAVVGPLGPDSVRRQVSLSEAHTCPHCGHGSYFVLALELTHLSTEDRREFERFMLRFYNLGGRTGGGEG